MKLPALSLLLIAPPGAGKSFTLWTALRSLGSGAVLLVPGADEEASYFDLLDNSSYSFGYADDPSGLKKALDWLEDVAKQVEQDLSEKKPPRYAVLGIDKGSEVGRFVYNAALAKFSIETAPPALSPDGAAFYSYLRTLTEKLMRAIRRVKRSGVNIIFTASPKDVEKVSEAAITADITPGRKLMVDWPGGSRDTIPGVFDLVFHVGIKIVETPIDGNSEKKRKERVHYLQWAPDPRRITKSRFGSLGVGTFPNDWREIIKRVEAAAKRKLDTFTSTEVSKGDKRE